MKNNKPLSIRLRNFVSGMIGRYFKLKSSPVIFCFHSISDDGWLFSVTPDNFESFVNKLSESRKIVCLNKILGDNGRKLGNNVAITFDDGYEDVIANAYPILKKHGLTACVFINGLPDINGNFGYLNGRKLLNLKQIKKLKRVGWEIGYHTKTHPDLRKLSEEQLHEEIVKNKRNLEKNLGFKLYYFAYPHGAYNKKIVRIVDKAGYAFAFVANGGGVDLNKTKHKIDRVIVDKYVKVEDLKILTSTAGLFINKLITYCDRIKDNLYEKNI